MRSDGVMHFDASRFSYRNLDSTVGGILVTSMSDSHQEEVRIARERRDGLATFLGVVVFLVGVGIVGWTFVQAFEIFTKAPQLNLGVEPGKPIDFSVVGLNLARLIVRILVLVVMAGIGSALANRGAKMYASGKTLKVHEPVQAPRD